MIRARKENKSCGEIKAEAEREVYVSAKAKLRSLKSIINKKHEEERRKPQLPPLRKVSSNAILVGETPPARRHFS